MPTSELKIRAALPAGVNVQRDYILLDASSSMVSRWWDALTAIDTYVSGIRGIESKITLTTFTKSGAHFFFEPTESSPAAWVPGQSPPMRAGMTPLYDAINEMVRRLRDLDPSKCSILIVTDGEDNASATTVEQARALLDWCRMKGWQVTVFGCDWDNSSLARRLGCDASAISTSARRLTDAASELAKKRSHHAKYGTPMEWSEEDQDRFGGYLVGDVVNI